MRQIFASIAIFFMSQLGALSVSTPITLSFSEGPSHPCVALNEKGEASVLWTTADLGEMSKVEVSTYNSKEWSFPSIIGKGGSHDDMINPQVAIDSDGTVFSVWKSFENGNPFFQWVKKEKNESLSSSTIEIQDTTVSSKYFLDNCGNFHFWDTDQGLRKFVTYEHQTQKKILQEMPLRSQSLALTPQGRELVVFLSESQGYFWNSYSFKGAWIKEETDPVTLIDFSIGSYQIYPVGVNDKGHIGVVWSKTNSLHDWIVGTVCIEGIWSELAPLVQRNGIQDIQSQIDAEGNFLVVWSKKEQGLFAAYKPKGENWLSPIQLLNSNPPRFEISQSKGHFVVIWDKVERHKAVHAAVFSKATLNWDFQQLSPLEVPCANAKIAFNEQGQGIVAWEAIINGRRQIQAAEISLE